MNEDYKGFTIYSANKDGGGTFYYMDGVIFPEKYKSVAAAKGAITRHLNKTADLPEIEVVPRIQPPKSILSKVHKERMMIVEVIPNALRGKFTHPLLPNATVHPIESRNKREGGYCGHYKAGDKNFKMAHYRVGPKGDYETLKERVRFNKIHGM